jgi:hypothetical protein
MFDFMQMDGGEQSQEMLYQMMRQQMQSRTPPEVQEAITKVEIVIKKRPRGFELNIGPSGHPGVEEMVRESVEAWTNMLSRGFQAFGYKVKVYE